MNAVPAIVSGVKRIVMTVPAINGVVNDFALACAKLLGIKEIYKIEEHKRLERWHLEQKELIKLIKL